MGIRTPFNPMGGARPANLANALVYTIEVPSAGYQQAVPINNATYINPIQIDWGDGTTETKTSGTYPTHIYASSGSYRITISNATGNIPYLNFGGNATSRATLKSIDFADVKFYRGTSEITTFYNCFSNCTSLTAIADNYFNKNVNTTDFSYCFRGCSQLSSVPETLFAGCTEVTSFAYLFYGCTSLTTVPDFLFADGAKVTSFSYSFYGCQSLQFIPSVIFGICPLVTTFSGCFQGCTSLTSIPNYLFAQNTAVTSFSSCFRNCSNLASFRNVFVTNLNVTDYSNCFDGCTKLQLRTGIFSSSMGAVNASIDFEYCFRRTSFNGTRGTAPDLWNFTFSRTPSTSGCFYGAGNSTTSLSNYADIPTSWIED